ncbi:hypothetical protein FMM05_17870 [Flavobacterium zepuense]|uniref:Lipoprotein n=1 Tax=Flavobacterium zepuense TaxID=2593302 RepID=A0A552UVU9_9FLAO|nr:hypothetical protein [Flavobacterium zepuense]TRW22374.1 hypothetical protein FMM05_17870 [Flavobacterium zepuense]
MRGLVLIILVCICNSITSCGFVKDKKIVGKYHIVAVDIPEDECLAYEVESGDYVCLVPPKAVAYCKNDRYIFLKQIPIENNDLDFDYYIVPTLNDSLAIYPEERIIGPLNEKEFDEEILKMNLKELEFIKLD